MAGSFNYDAQLADLEQRQKIADALATGSLAPLQGVSAGGMYAAPHWTEGLGKVLQAYAASKGRDQIKADRTALADKYNTELAKGAENFYRTSEGYSESSLARTPNADGTPQTVNVPGNPRKAIFDALASGHPVLQQMAMQQLAAQQKGVVTPEKLSALATPESVLANPNNPAKWVPKRELKGMQPGEVLIDAAGNIATPGAGATGGQPSTSTPGGTPSGQGWNTINIGGDLYQQSATGLKKLDNAPKVTNNISLNPVMKGESKFMEQLGEDTGKMVTAARQAKQIGQQTLVMADRLTQLQQKGVFTGPTANIAVTASALADALKLPGVREKLASSEEFKSLIGKQAAAALSGPGGAKMTDKDMELFLSQYPQLTNSSVGIPAIIQAVTTAAQQQIGYANQVEANLRKNYPEAARLWDVAPTNVGFPTPANAGGSGPGTPIPLDQYLQNFGGR